jgi:hypothetical protein
VFISIYVFIILLAMIITRISVSAEDWDTELCLDTDSSVCEEAAKTTEDPEQSSSQEEKFIQKCHCCVFFQ